MYQAKVSEYRPVALLLHAGIIYSKTWMSCFGKDFDLISLFKHPPQLKIYSDWSFIWSSIQAKSMKAACGPSVELQRIACRKLGSVGHWLSFAHAHQCGRGLLDLLLLGQVFPRLLAHVWSLLNLGSQHLRHTCDAKVSLSIRTSYNYKDGLEPLLIGLLVCA